MNIIKKDKMCETLTNNWAKYTDYKLLLELVVRTVKLYASNWTLIQSEHNFNGNKISVTKAQVNNLGFQFLVNFELLIDNSVAKGHIIINIPFSGSYNVEKIEGNLFFKQH